MRFQIEEINLARGPNPKWVQSLPQPYNTFRPAKTFGELTELAPSMWTIYARRCLVDVVVYGNGRHSFAIQHVAGLMWRFRGADSCDGETCLDRVVMEKALAPYQYGCIEDEIKRRLQVFDWDACDILSRVALYETEGLMWLKKLEELRDLRSRQREDEVGPS